MTTVYLGLGGNIGDTAAYIYKAVEQLRAHSNITCLRLSSLYQTQAISDIAQRDFINAVCVFETTLSPEHLLSYTQQIEKQLGKVPKPKQAPRCIDLDILLYGIAYIDTPQLQLPHPYWMERLFVLLPLAELTQTVWLPTLQGPQEVAISALLMVQMQHAPQRIYPLLPDERIDRCIQ